MVSFVQIYNYKNRDVTTKKIIAYLYFLLYKNDANIDDEKIKKFKIKYVCNILITS